MTEKWTVGEPGGPAGPFYSVVKPDGQIVAMQVLTREMADLIASIPDMKTDIELLRETLLLARENFIQLAATVPEGREHKRDHALGRMWPALEAVTREVLRRTA